MVSGGFKKCQSYLIKNLWKLEWVLFSLHASLYVRYHYFPRNTCLLPDKMAILQKKTNIEDNKYMYIFSVL